MDAKIQSQYEHYFSRIFMRAAHSEVALRVIEALEDGGLPRDRKFSVDEALKAIKPDEIACSIQIHSDPLFGPENPRNYGRKSLSEKARLLTFFTLADMVAHEDGILDSGCFIQDGFGRHHQISVDEQKGILAGKEFYHPETNEKVRDALDRIAPLFWLKDLD